MDSANRVLRIIQVAFIVSVLVYAGLAEFVFGDRVQPEPNMTLLNAIAAAAGVAMVVGYFVRQHFLRRAKEAMSADPSGNAGLADYRMALFLSLTFAESFGLFGFALRAMGYDNKFTIPFFIVSFGLLLIWGPRRLQLA